VRPEKISILNVLEAKVIAIAEEVGPIVDVQLATGGSILTSRITRRSVAALNIQVGQPIFALVKAVSFDQRSVGYAQGPRSGEIS
jgi:molybdate transport system ATP-binding protein